MLLDDAETLETFIVKIKLKPFEDLVSVVGIEFGAGEYYENIYDIMEQNKLSLKDVIIYREDIYNMLRDYGYGGDLPCNHIDEACPKIMDRVRKGRKLTDAQYEDMVAHNLSKWFVATCNTIDYASSRFHY